MTLFPWQQQRWQQLMAQRASLPHALLLTGEAGIGKRQFAEYLAQYLLCETADKTDRPCGHCAACTWFMEGNHPDFRLLSLDETGEVENTQTATGKKPGQWITVEMIRALTDFVHVGAHRRGQRVILVYPAEAMNVAAANAFLKMLEEPPKDVVFILVSHHWQRLLPTIKSRCRRFALPMPDEAQALSWLTSEGVDNAYTPLRHFGGAPLRALAHAKLDQTGVLTLLLDKLAQPGKLNVGELAADIEKLKAETVDVVECLQKWVLDNVLYQQTGQIHYYPDYEAALPGRGQFGPQLWAFYDMLLEARRYARHPLNQRLLLEKIFYAWIDVLKESYQRTVAE